MSVLLLLLFRIPRLSSPHPQHHFIVKVSSKPCYFMGRRGVFEIGRFGQFPHDLVVGTGRSRISRCDTHEIIENDFYQNKDDESNVPADF